MLAEYRNVCRNMQIQKKQGSICETRKGPDRPPIRRGIGYFVYAHVLNK